MPICILLLPGLQPLARLCLHMEAQGFSMVRFVCYPTHPLRGHFGGLGRRGSASAFPGGGERIAFRLHALVAHFYVFAHRRLAVRLLGMDDVDVG